MRLGSDTAYRKALSSWDALMSDKARGEVGFADELFALADVFKAAPALTASLEDGARSADDRAELARNVLGAKVSGEVQDLVVGLAREKWSENGDLIRSVEALAVQTLLAGAARESQLDIVENELYSIRDTLMKERELRSTLSDPKFDLASRKGLAAKVFTSASTYTEHFIERALEKAPQTSIRESLSEYIDAAGERSSHLVASVTAALPLTSEQEQRLISILSKQYGKDVRIHTTIDTSVVGGVRVLIGDDVIDGTIANRLATVKEVFSNGR